MENFQEEAWGAGEMGVPAKVTVKKEHTLVFLPTQYRNTSVLWAPNVWDFPHTKPLCLLYVLPL